MGQDRTCRVSWSIFSSFFSLIFLFVPCGGLSWLHVRLLLHVKYTLSYHISGVAGCVRWCVGFMWSCWKVFHVTSTIMTWSKICCGCPASKLCTHSTSGRWRWTEWSLVYTLLSVSYKIKIKSFLAEPGGIGPWRGLLTIVLQCYDTVGWVMWPVKPSPKWPIMCRVGR